MNILRLIAVITSLFVLVNSQDLFNLPSLLVDIYPGASMSLLTHIPNAGKVYGSVTIPGKI